MRCCSACGVIYRVAVARCMNDGAEVIEVERDPLIGTRVGSYLVDAFLGEGGMGRVYRAHHVHLAHKLYALKVLIGDYAGTPAMRIRFAKEAENASKLSHANIASVSDFGRTDTGLLFIAMDLVEGRPLNELMTNEPMAPSRVIALVRQLCAGLGHAHDLGLIHRDFKPENILVVDTPAGEVPKIVDFGLAIANDHSDSRVTTTGMVMGTPAYIAPEQCLNGTIDHRVDLYALGVTMFELLSGGFLPFDGEAAEVVGLKVSTPAPSLAERAPRLAAGLVTLVDRLLARRPAQRFADTRAVLAALDEVAREPDAIPAPAIKRADDTVVEAQHRRAKRGDDAGNEIAPIHTGRTQFVRMPNRNRWVLAILAACVPSALVVVVWSLRASDRPTPSAPPPVVARAAVPSVAAPDPAPVVVASIPPRVDPKPKDVARATISTKRTNRPHSTRIRATRVASAKLAKPAPAPDLATPPPPPPPVEIVAARPVALDARIDGLTVDGALPSATVRRALDRVMPAVRACRGDKPGVVNVKFSIGEARRATGTSASGISPGVAGCVAAAIGALRTESAPDVGDVQVRVVVGFERRG